MALGFTRLDCDSAVRSWAGFYQARELTVLRDWGLVCVNRAEDGYFHSTRSGAVTPGVLQMAVIRLDAGETSVGCARHTR